MLLAFFSQLACDYQFLAIFPMKVADLIHWRQQIRIAIIYFIEDSAKSAGE